MAEPIFDRNAYQSAPAAPRIVESASASTACQTNDSKFAYILTAGVLGVIALLAIAVTLLIFAVATTSVNNAWHEPADMWLEEDFGYEDLGYEDTWL